MNDVNLYFIKCLVGLDVKGQNLFTKKNYEYKFVFNIIDMNSAWSTKSSPFASASFNISFNSLSVKFNSASIHACLKLSNVRNPVLSI